MARRWANDDESMQRSACIGSRPLAGGPAGMTNNSLVRFTTITRKFAILLRSEARAHTQWAIESWRAGKAAGRTHGLVAAPIGFNPAPEQWPAQAIGRAGRPPAGRGESLIELAKNCNSVAWQAKQ